MALAILLSFFSFTFMAMSSPADLLQNPDFEYPPTNTTVNASTPLVLLTKANSIPGWSFNGTVWYVTSGPNISLPGNGHALQLGPGGKINQTFNAKDNHMGYVLTFTLVPGSENCSNNFTSVNVSAPGKSQVFFFDGRYGKETWEIHAYNLGIYYNGKNDLMNLVIQSTDHNSSCWPVVDKLLIRRVELAKSYGDNMVMNGGFEIGPAFLRNSSEGILLHEEQGILDEESQPVLSPLQEWSIIGTVKYIDSKHYAVPRGEAAIQLLANSAVVTNQYLKKGSTYTLDFMIGDAKDSCIADFLVYVQAGMTVWNFTMHSNGLGSAQKHSITFKAESATISISFGTFNEIQTSDHVLCGPVIDSIKLISFSHRLGADLQNGVLLSCLVFILLIVDYYHCSISNIC